MSLKKDADIQQVAADIIGFFESLIAQVFEILKKLEEHFAFTEPGYVPEITETPNA